jgi:Na+/melibiose symporter-like transporter
MFADARERQQAIGLWAGTSGVGIALGPIVGGLLLVHFWWGSVFLINVPIAVAGLACALPLVPDSRNRAALAPDLPGALLSIAGLGMLLYAIIEAPVKGWSSAEVIGTGLGSLVILGGFSAWERATSHPMLSLAFFRNRSFSAAISSVSLATFGMFGALFVLTQFMQFNLGYSALAAGLRVLPAAGAIAVVAPVSPLLIRAVGSKLTAAAGLAIVAAGLWQISGATVTSTYLDTVAGMIMLGAGAGLVIPTATALVMGSVPRQDTGIGSAANGTFLQIGGALGVAVIGSLLSTRYQHHLTSALAPYHVPHQALSVILGSLGGALAVAARAGGLLGSGLAHLARSAFIGGMDLGLIVGAFVALAGCLLALAAIPGRRRPEPGPAEPPQDSASA